MTLRHIPTRPFIFRLKQSKGASCASLPSGLQHALQHGVKMDLELVMHQAGRHFADSINPAVLPGSGTRRQKAAELAWFLLAMLDPKVVDAPIPNQKGAKGKPPKSEPRLVVVKPDDQDIQRLATEIFGVGATLELLRQQRVVDGRTFTKQSSRFDFEANEVGGGGRVRIEAKGTLNGVSSSAQRRSIRNKLTNVGGTYSRSLGVIVNLSTSASSKHRDAELLDPPGDAQDDRDGALRAAIRHYARVYDNDIQLERAATFLWELAAQPVPIEQLPSLDDWLSYQPRTSRVEHRFNRASLVLDLGHQLLEFWGGYWESYGTAHPVQASTSQFPVGYIGVDARVVSLLRARAFDAFLNFKGEAGVFEFEGEDVVAGSSSAPIDGVLIVEADGSVRAWLSKAPRGTIRA